MKPKYIVLLFLITCLSVLTLALRGAVPEKTYVHSKIPASAVRSTIVSYNPWSGAGWGVDDFSVDFDNWLRHDQNVISSFYLDDRMLCLKTIFDNNRGHQSVKIFRSLNVDVSELPVFRINVSVSEGAIYHIRFVGEDSAGVKRQVWWETSPLDDIPGKSRWETHAVDLTAFSEQATGSSVPTMTLVEIIIENPHSYKSEGEKSLRISHIGFSKRSLRVSNIPGNATFVSSDEPFQAVIIELPCKHIVEKSWDVRWAAVTYTLTSNSEFPYEMLLLSRDGELLQDAHGPAFLSHGTSFVDIYRLDATPKKVIPRSEELTFLWPFLGNLSIAIIKREIEPGGFLMFELNSIELMYSNENINSDPILDVGQIAFMGIGMTTAIIVVPIILWVLLSLQTKSDCKNPRSFFLMTPLVYGIVGRFVMAPFTGHPYDMQMWTQPVRLFYESGVIDIRTFPLPFTYYLLLLAYSPYALLRILGFQDATFLAHESKMVESIFIKAPFVLSDILSLYFLLKIFNRFSNNEPNSPKTFACALMYFLNPLAILLSSVWGMCDGIAVALFLAGIYYTLLEKKPFHGALSYALSGLTKGFGFLGLISLSFTSIRERKVFQLLAILGMILAVVILLYSPLLAISGIQGIPELFMHFLRGRTGLGSNTPYVAGSSYMFYLSLQGLRVGSSYLTYLLAALVSLVSIHYGLRMQDSVNENRVELTLRYFALVFFIFYLGFFRIYEQYYLWVIPILIAYSYLKGTTGPSFMALCIALLRVAVPETLGALLTGTEYYWFPLNLPADAAVMAVLPSTLAALGLISMLDWKGPLAVLKTGRGISAFAGFALWFSFGLAYYGYYGAPFLGMAWYPISLAIVFTVAAFLYRKLRSKRMEEFMPKWIDRFRS